MVLPQPAPAPFSHQSTGNIINSSMGSLFWRSLPAYPCPKVRPLFPLPRFEHTPHHLPIPQRPPTRPRLLPRHRYRCRRHPMLTGQDSLSKLCRQSHGRARSSLLSSPSHGSTSIIGKPVKAVASAAPTSSAVALKKPKTTCGQFAYVTQAVW